MSKHFENKGALGHVLEKRAENHIVAEEGHGGEIPDHLYAAYEAAQQMAILILFVGLLLDYLPVANVFVFLIAFGSGLLVWTTGKCAWMGWAHLERLHRLIEQERYEIINHRPQEREELMALYCAKGFQGKLLDDVIDTLMADQDRLLTVMLEEEMGLNLQTHSHPIEKALGSAVGGLLALGLLLFAYHFFSIQGLFLSSFLIVSIHAASMAYHKKNRVMQAVVWNLSLAALGFATTYFVYQLSLHFL